MSRLFQLVTAALLSGVVLAASAQARLILNGGTVILNGGATLVIANPNPDAITHTSGFIKSEGEENQIFWYLGPDAHTYTIPWGLSATEYIPLSFTTQTTGAGGYYQFSTYRTSWANRTQLPAGVSSFSTATGVDKSGYAVDRFWKLMPQAPGSSRALKALTFTYASDEFGAPNHATLEDGLTAQRWNGTLATWNDFIPEAQRNGRQVAVPYVDATEMGAWWTLAYVPDRYWGAASMGSFDHPSNWAMSRRGPGNASRPGPMDIVIIQQDAVSDLVIARDVTLAGLVTESGYKGTVQVESALTLAGDLAIGGGEVRSGSSEMRVRGLTIAGGSFTAPTAVLEVAGDFAIASGSFHANGGTVRFAGTESQHIYGPAHATFNNLAISNAAGVSVEGNHQLAGVLSLDPGSAFDADGKDNASVFTLLSMNDSPAADAAIAALPANASFTGEVTVQRYMSIEGANQGNIYRYIASPVQRATVSDIQGEIPVTGPFSGSSVCAGCPKSYSLYEYSEAVVHDLNKSGVADLNDGYYGYPGVTNQETLMPGRGYSLYVPGALLTRALWDVRGSINQGSVPLPVSHTDSGKPADDGWNLVGNPYAATIDWNAAEGWTKKHVEGSIYVRNNGNNPVQFATWNGVVGTNGGSRYIATGQAFWVKADGHGVPELTAHEVAKTPQASAEFFRAVPLTDLLRITLIKGTQRDEAVIHFRSDATDAYDTAADAVKFLNGGFSLSSELSDKTRLAINSQAPLDCQKEMVLAIDNIPVGSYSLSFEGMESFRSSVAVVLVDHFTGKEFPVEGELYPFSVTSHPESKKRNRFGIRFSKTPEVPVALTQGAEVCSGTDGHLMLVNADPSVVYSASIGSTWSSPFGHTDNGTEVTLPSDLLNPGLNTVVVTALACGQSLRTEVSVTVSSVARIDSVWSESICTSGSAELGVSGDAATFQWYQEGSEQVAGTGSRFVTPVLAKSKTYFVRPVTATGCVGEATPVEAKVVPLSHVALEVHGDTLLSGSTEGNEWYYENALLPGETSDRLVMDEPGVYVNVVTVDGCSVTSEFTQLVTGIGQQPEISVSVYPNPVIDQVTIEAPPVGNQKTADLFSLSGTKVATIVMEESGGVMRGAYRMGHLPSGLYVLRITGAKDVKLVKR